LREFQERRRVELEESPVAKGQAVVPPADKPAHASSITPEGKDKTPAPGNLPEGEF